MVPKNYKKRVYDKDSFDRFYVELSCVDNWSDVYNLCQNAANTSAAFDSFHSRYVAIFEKCFPVKTQN